MNYDKYSFSMVEWIICLGKYVLIGLTLSFLFYDSVKVFIFSLPLCCLFVKREKANKKRKRKDEVAEEFLKALQSVSTSVSAGYSFENAFIEAAADMERLFGKKGYIVIELKAIARKISCGIRIKEALNDFAVRSGIESIRDFALIFESAKDSGGNLNQVITRCIDIMESNRKTKDEIKVLLRQKQFEQRIMSAIPPGIILYLRMSSGSFLEVLYHNLRGCLIMTFCLVMYLVSILISEKICEICV